MSGSFYEPGYAEDEIAAQERMLSADDDTPRCMCGAMLAQMGGGRQVCTIHPELVQEAV
ncbi:MAG: hypothetical protein KF698_08420 [Anaerolineales bacterium]|nr:hypothetical protein [Anaerolineales bacterium]